MANDILIERSGERAKIRNPWLVLLFSLVSFGIYAIFWWYFVNRELADLGRARGSRELGEKPWLSVLAYTLGSLVYIPLIWTLVATNQRLRQAQRITVGQSVNGWLMVALWLLMSLGGIVYMQYELNKVWRAPGMRPAGDPDPSLPAGDLERAEKLEWLRTAGALSDEEERAQRQRLDLPPAD